MLTITQIPNKGRCFTATTNLSSGDVIFRDQPYAIVPDCGAKSFVCASCINWITEPESIDKQKIPPTLPIACTGGCDIRYCSKECRDKDWTRFHQYECTFLTEMFSTFKSSTLDVRNPANRHCFSGYTLDYLWLLIRTLVQRHHEINNEAATKGFDAVWQLCSNSELFVNERKNEFQRVTAVLADFVETRLTMDVGIADPTEKMTRSQLEAALMELICKEECNSFGLYTFEFEGWRRPRQGFALALYPNAVFFNHSCLPNTGHIPRRLNSLNSVPEMVFYALRDIKLGEELLISYVELAHHTDVLVSVTKRRADLKEMFFFDCDCTRCYQEMMGLSVIADGLECKKDGCNGWLVPTNLKKQENIDTKSKNS
ncbi:hypothetical protein HK096_004620, partial [Nowakowskiella sp. JEL0078]